MPRDFDGPSFSRSKTQENEPETQRTARRSQEMPAFDILKHSDIHVRTDCVRNFSFCVMLFEI